jgi:hypothetical protein
MTSPAVLTRDAGAARFSLGPARDRIDRHGLSFVSLSRFSPERHWAALVLVWLLVCACEPAGTSPSPVASVSSTASALAPSAPAPSINPTPSVPVSATAAAASSSASAAPSTLDTQPALVDGEGKPLPQTEERPTPDSASFVSRMQALVAAIREDKPELAHAAFFPLVAYEQVKAIKNPQRDYDKRLLAAFDRDLRALRKKLGKHAGSLRFVGVDVPDAKVQWMARGKEGNRLGYYRVTRAQLRVASDAALHPIVLKSLISWRGEWYVVHLSSFE